MHHTTSPDGVDSLLVVPNAALVQFDHHIERTFGGVFVRVLEKAENEVLELLVDVVVLCLFVQIFQVVDDATVQEFTQFFVLASEELKENGEDGSRSDDILASHDFESCD